MLLDMIVYANERMCFDEGSLFFVLKVLTGNFSSEFTKS